MNKNIVISIILAVLAIGAIAGYYFGYDHGWERAVQQGQKSTESADEQTENPLSEGDALCVNQCGNGICEEIVCQGTGCPCAETAETCPQDCAADASENQPTSMNSNRFNIETAKVGDTVGEMTIVDIRPFGPLPGAALSPEIRIDNAIVRFTGQVTISGSYHYYDKSEPLIADIVCFESQDAESRKKMPLAEGEERGMPFPLVRFCFSNQDVAKKEFGLMGSKGTATIVIDEYVAKYFPTEGYNEATLVKVIAKMREN